MPSQVKGCLRTGRGHCQGEPTFEVVYRSSDRSKVIEREGPFCFGHGLEQVDRACAAGSMAQADLVEATPDPSGGEG